jgi:hypothetical protein
VNTAPTILGPQTPPRLTDTLDEDDNVPVSNYVVYYNNEPDKCANTFQASAIANHTNMCNPDVISTICNPDVKTEPTGGEGGVPGLGAWGAYAPGGTGLESSDLTPMHPMCPKSAFDLPPATITSSLPIGQQQSMVGSGYMYIPDRLRDPMMPRATEMEDVIHPFDTSLCAVSTGAPPYMAKNEIQDFTCRPPHKTVHDNGQISKSNKVMVPAGKYGLFVLNMCVHVSVICSFICNLYFHPEIC